MDTAIQWINTAKTYWVIQWVALSTLSKLGPGIQGLQKGTPKCFLSVTKSPLTLHNMSITPGLIGKARKKKGSFILKWNINRAKQQPINTKIQQIHQHSVAFTDAWDSHLLLLAAKQCFPSSCQPELNSGCYWPLVCSWILSALFEIFWFVWCSTKIQHCDQAWISAKLL